MNKEKIQKNTKLRCIEAFQGTDASGQDRDWIWGVHSGKAQTSGVEMEERLSTLTVREKR
jgi:hypothetical protein